MPVPLERAPTAADTAVLFAIMRLGALVVHELCRSEARDTGAQFLEREEKRHEKFKAKQREWVANGKAESHPLESTSSTSRQPSGAKWAEPISFCGTGLRSTPGGA